MGGSPYPLVPGAKSTGLQRKNGNRLASGFHQPERATDWALGALQQASVAFLRGESSQASDQRIELIHCYPGYELQWNL
jgi:hypothetical protein